MAYQHQDPAGAWGDFAPKHCEIIARAMALNPGAGSVTLPDIPFEVRWGTNAKSAKMPNIPNTNMIQVNVNNGNSRIVRRNHAVPIPETGPAASPGMIVMTATVPPGAEPGHQINVELPGGQPFHVAVPPGLEAGQTFQFQAPGPRQFQTPKPIVTFSHSANYLSGSNATWEPYAPDVSARIALAARAGVFLKPSRLGSSPIARKMISYAATSCWSETDGGFEDAASTSGSHGSHTAPSGSRLTCIVGVRNTRPEDRPGRRARARGAGAASPLSHHILVRSPSGSPTS